jgi:polysaccharide biosynthesis/export protein
MKTIVFLFVLTATQLSAQGERSINQVSGLSNLQAKRIRSNDLINIEVYGSPELTRSARVASDGAVELPLVKQRINVGGLMPTEAAVAVAGVLAKEAIIIDPVVTITVAEYHQNEPISVVGAVKTPVTFQTNEDVTLLEAISRSGGLTPQAGPEILVSQGKEHINGGSSGLVRRISVKELIDGTDPNANPLLTGGEEVRIPEVGRVFVLGNVKKPGAFPSGDGNRGTTVIRLLALSEGLLPNARRQAFIYRQDSGVEGKNQISIELENILNGKAADVPLKSDDILYIPDNRGRRETLAVLEKMLLLGSGAIGGITYAALAH